MTEMREWWINVYPRAEEHRRLGFPHEEVRHANGALDNRRSGGWEADQTAFRIHVRLKPEGAPKRYASEANRRAWEVDPMWCKKATDCGHDATSLISWKTP